MKAKGQKFKEMKERINAFFTRPIKAVILIATLFISIAFIGKRYEEREIVDVNITIQNLDNNFFLDESDISEILMSEGNEVLNGTELGDINLRNLESRLIKSPFISRSEIFVNHLGHLNVEVWLKKPIVRVIPELGSHYYICSEKSIVPISDRYTSRVMILSGKGLNAINGEDSLQSGFGAQLYDFVNVLLEDEFWSSQIAEIEVEEDRELILYPQITKQYIEFGTLEKRDEKLKKLRLFYDEVLPFKGWNHYERVCLKYENQIVCE